MIGTGCLRLEIVMPDTLADMTKEEFKEMLEALIEQKLVELVGSPDEDLPVRKSVRDRLLKQKKAAASGEKGEPLDEAVQRLGLEYPLPETLE
jgi:DNA primase large subunit